MQISTLILAETKSWLAVNKPAGISVECQPGVSDTLEDLILSYLQEKNNRPFLGIVHRLDRLTSGVLLFAKKKSTLSSLNAQFRAGTTKKIYLARTVHAPQNTQGTLRHWLLKDQLGKKALILPYQHKDAAEVILKYTVKPLKDHGYLWEIQLLSGKFHQIRAQLAAIGCPILGDILYGGIPVTEHAAIALHAWKLTFQNPENGETIPLIAPLPTHVFWQIE